MADTTKEKSMDDLPVTVLTNPYQGAEVGEYTEMFDGSPASAQKFAKYIIGLGGKARIGRRGSVYYVYHRGAGPLTKTAWRRSLAV